MGMEMRLTQGITSSVLFTLTDGTNCSVDADRGGWKQSPLPEAEEWATDTVDITLLGGIATIEASMATLLRALRKASIFDGNGAWESVFLEVRKSSTGTWYRSQVKGGELRDMDLDQAIRTGTMDAQLSITRKNFLEGPETEVPLTTPNYTRRTGGVIIKNCNDLSGSVPSKRCNYVEVAAQDVAGSIPAGCKISASWTEEAATKFTVFMGIGANYEMALTNNLEGEASNATDVADASCAGGYYGYIDSPNGMYWQVVSQYTKGRWFWPIARAKFASASERLTIKVDEGHASQIQYFYPGVAGADFGLFSLGMLKLPGKYFGPNPDNDPQIWLTPNVGRVSMDFLELLPADFWRQMEIDTGAVNLNPLGFIANTYDDFEYLCYNTSAKAPIATVLSGPGIYLQPGKVQRLFILSQSGSPGDAGGAVITRSLTVQMWYRPRVRVL